MAPWITVLSQHTVFTIAQLGWFTNLPWCGILLNKAPRTGPHHIWCIYTLCPFSGREKNTGCRAVGWMISLASAITEHLLRLPLVFQQIGRWGSLGFAKIFKFFTRRRLKSRWVYLAAHEDVSNCWVLLGPEGGKNNFLVHSKERWLTNSCWPNDQNRWCAPCAGCTIP